MVVEIREDTYVSFHVFKKCADFLRCIKNSFFVLTFEWQLTQDSTNNWPMLNIGGPKSALNGQNKRKCLHMFIFPWRGCRVLAMVQSRYILPYLPSTVSVAMTVRTQYFIRYLWMGHRDRF